jgi:pimeloyl-ACP methyl ester carboxylesterase
LLWHGFLATGYVWRKVASALAEAGFSVLVPDVRGYGDSDKPAGIEEYDVRALAQVRPLPSEGASARNRRPNRHNGTSAINV